MATPLTSLGQALERGTRDRANITLSREAEERQRMQRLQDVQSERDFVVGQRDRERGLSREAEERQITIKTLIDARFLNPAQVNDPVAVQQAAAAYQEFVESERARRASTIGNAQGEVNQLAADRDILTAKRAEADQRLARLQQQYEEVAAASGSLQPTPQDEMIEALRLAQQAGVVVPTVEPKRSEALREFVAQARDTLQTAAFLAQQETAKRLDGLRRQYEAEVRNADAITRELQVVRQSMDSLQRGFEVAPVRQSRSPAASFQPEAPAPMARTPAIASDADRDEARRSFLPPAPAPAPAAPMASNPLTELQRDFDPSYQPISPLVDPVAVVPSAADASLARAQEFRSRFLAPELSTVGRGGGWPRTPADAFQRALAEQDRDRQQRERSEGLRRLLTSGVPWGG